MKLNTKGQTVLNSFFLFLSGFDEFKQSLAVAIIDYFIFLFKIKQGTNKIKVSQLINLSDQVMYCPELEEIALKKGKVIDFLKGIQILIT